MIDYQTRFTSTTQPIGSLSNEPPMTDDETKFIRRAREARQSDRDRYLVLDCKTMSWSALRPWENKAR